MNRIAALALCGLAGCASRGSEAPLDTAGRRDSIAAVAAASLRPEHVLGLLDHVHASDSAVGSLGATQAWAPAVKDFGRAITREHRALRRELERLATEMGLAVQSPLVRPDEPPSILRERLDAGGPGAGWDRAYLEYAIAIHHSALENTARALAANSNPETRAFIVRSIPILQKHLDKAQSLRKAMASVSSRDTVRR